MKGAALRRFLSLSFATVFVFAMAGQALAAEDRAYTSWWEDDNNYKGDRVSFSDVNWTIPCSTIQYNTVFTFVNVFPSSGTGWAQVGHAKWKQPSTGTCPVLDQFYGEENHTEYRREFFNTPTPNGNDRAFEISKTDGGAQCDNPGAAWCWAFKIDGTTKMTCCGDAAGWDNVPDVSFQTECVFNTDDPGTGCPNTGKVDEFHAMKYKKMDSSWVAWSGKDRACIEYAQNARGKWTSATSGIAGFNVNVNNSIQGCVP